MNTLFTSVYVEMAEAKLAEGELDAAMELYKSALAENPRDLGALTGLARLLMENHDGYAAAEVLLRRACEHHPAAPAPRRALAALCHATGRHGQARAELFEAERLEARRAGQEAKGSGLFDRLRSFGSHGPQPPGQPAPARAGERAAASRPRRGDCPYCGSTRRPGARVCGRCGATL